MPHDFTRREMLRVLLAGTTFPLIPALPGWALLPPSVPQTQTAPISSLPVPAPVLISYRDPDCLFLMRLILERVGIRTAAAPTGPQALEYCRTQPVTMILTDLLKIGGMAGDELVRQLRAEPATRALPVLFIDTAGHAEAVRRGLAAGADDYLPLPMQPGDLVDRIRRCLPMRGPDSPFNGQRRISGQALAARAAELRAERDRAIRPVALPGGTVVRAHA